MRHPLHISLLLITLGLLIAACSPASPTVPPSTPTALPPTLTAVPATPNVPPTAPAPAAAPTTAASDFPLTIKHKYGSTTIAKQPERIVLVGLTEQDTLLALGIVPVATREWYGGQPGAIFPWAKDKLGNAALPVVLGTSELNFEQIASLKPDVIVGLYSGLTQDEYDTLSKIAPTVAQPAEYVDFGIPWQAETKTLGSIVGKQAEAEQLVANVEAKFADARKQHPEFNGATAIAISGYGYPDSYYAYSSQDARGRFLTSLGFKVPDAIDQLAGTQFGAAVSREKLELIDVDALVWIDVPIQDRDQDPLYQKLNVYKQRRDVFLPHTDPLYDALNFSTVLSLPYAIDGLVPRLAAAVDGDPTTNVPALESSTPLPTTAATAEPTTLSPTAEPTAAPVSAAFPITVTHRLGETVVKSAPQRVVALGVNDIDTALALGFTPIAINADPFTADGISPWLQGKIDPTKTVILPPSAELPLEKITALKPDVILATGQYGIDDSYALLSKIAPTLADLHGPDADTWQEQSLAIGQVLGTESEAKQLIADTENQIAAVKQNTPGLANKTFSLSYAYDPAKLITLNSTNDFSAKFFQSIGLVLAPALTKLGSSPNDPTHADLSLEQINLIDADLVMMTYDTPDLQKSYEANPLFQKLSAVQKGNYVVVDLPIASEMRYPSLLGIPAVLKQLQPALNRVAGASPTPTTASSSAVFPITVTHALGTVTIPAAPRRVVALGMSDADVAYALGVTPIAISRDPYNSTGVPPWLTAQFDASKTKVLPAGDLSIEHIASLHPDLILASSFYQIDDTYALLSKIAPTIAYKTASAGDSWQVQTQLVGQALGKASEAQQQIAAAEAQIAALKNANPQLAGKTFTLSYMYDSNAIATVWSEQDLAVKFLEQFGLVITPQLSNIADFSKSQSAILSEEQLGLLDADLAIWAYGTPELQKAYEANPLYQNLNVVKDNRFTVVDLETVAEIRSPTLLGIPWVLDALKTAFAKIPTR